MGSFPSVIVRYERGSDERAEAIIVFYARSFEHASDVLHSLTTLRRRYDPTAMYAIRKTIECYVSPSLYPCACGGSVGGTGTTAAQKGDFMEPWQVEALQALLATEIKQVEEARVYTSSKTYGESRFHLLSKRYRDILIEQTNIDDKWSSRVTFPMDELPAVLKTLLTWYLEDVQRQQQEAPMAPDETALDDLEEHPF